MKIKLLIVVQIIFFFIKSYIYSQECYNYKLFTTENKPPQNIINDVFKDINNLFWIVTMNGLDIFDGQQITLIEVEGQKRIIKLHINKVSELVYLNTLLKPYVINNYESKKLVLSNAHKKKIPNFIDKFKLDIDVPIFVPYNANLLFKNKQNEYGIDFNEKLITKEDVYIIKQITLKQKEILLHLKKQNQQFSPNLNDKFSKVSYHFNGFYYWFQVNLIYQCDTSKNICKIQKKNILPDFLEDLGVFNIKLFWKDDYLFLMTNKGLTPLNIKHDSNFKSDTTPNDPVRNIFYTQALLPDNSIIKRNGFLWIPTKNGLIQFSPQSFKPKLPYSPLTVIKIVYDLLHLAIHNGTLFFKQKKSIFNIRLLTSNFGNIDNNYLYYRVKKLQEDWTPIGYNMTITLPQFNKGNYILEVKKLNGFGEGNYQIKRVYRTILLFYYETWGFRLSMLLIFILGVYLLVYFYYLRLLKKNKRLKKSVSKKEVELFDSNEQLKLSLKQNHLLISTLVHDIRTPIKFLENISLGLKTHWSIMPEKEKLKYIETIYSSSQNTNRFINEFLEWLSNSEKSYVEFNVISLYDSVNDVIAFFQTHPKIKAEQIKIVNDVSTGLSIVSNDNLLKIVIRNLIDNSLKYSNSGVIRIYGEKSSETTELYITDEGKGFSEKELQAIISNNNHGSSGSGGFRMGYIFIKDIMRMLKGEVILEYPSEKGAKVKLQFKNYQSAK